MPVTRWKPLASSFLTPVDILKVTDRLPYVKCPIAFRYLAYLQQSYSEGKVYVRYPVGCLMVFVWHNIPFSGRYSHPLFCWHIYLPSSPLISSPPLCFLFWKVYYALKSKISIKHCKWNYKTFINLHWRVWKLIEHVCVIESLNTRHRLPLQKSISRFRFWRTAQDTDSKMSQFKKKIWKTRSINQDTKQLYLSKCLSTHTQDFALKSRNTFRYFSW
jgi:hypothetical protein